MFMGVINHPYGCHGAIHDTCPGDRLMKADGRWAFCEQEATGGPRIGMRLFARQMKISWNCSWGDTPTFS